MVRQRAKAVALSIVIPFFNEEESLERLYEEIKPVLNGLGLDYEILFVDDGSTDGSFSKIEKLHRSDPQVKGLQFRCNQGKASALSLGFQEARGKYVITLDADLQDDPKEIPRLLEKIEDGYDLVSGWKVQRQDPLAKRLPSKVFNFTTSLLTGMKLHDFNCGFKAYRQEVAKSLNIYGELHRYIPVLAQWRGFKVAEIPVNHRPRPFGHSKYGPERFVRGFLDLLTTIFLTRFTKRPLHFFGSPGLLLGLAGFFINCYIASLWFKFGNIQNRHPLLLLGILLMVLGGQLISLGLLGEMLAHSSNRGDQEPPIRKRLL